MKTKSMTIWVMVVVLCLTSPKAMGWLQFKDGGTHNIDYEIADDVWVDWQSPGMETMVNLLAGGSITNNLQGYNDSHINISSGSIGGHLYAYDNSQVTMSSGWIGWDVLADSTSQVNISGGSMGNDLFANDSSQVTISGGELERQLYANNNSQVTISGGWIGYELRARDSSQVDISGGWNEGVFFAYGSSQVDISGGSVEKDLIVYQSATLTIYGSDFTVDGQPFGYGELTSIFGGSYSNEPSRYLTGMLANGDALDNTFYIGNDSKITLIPEPATLLLLGLGAVMLRRKRS